MHQYKTQMKGNQTCGCTQFPTCH